MPTDSTTSGANREDSSVIPLSSELLQNFFEHSIELLCIAGKDGYFKHINTAFTTTLGHSKEHLLSKPFLDFVHPEDKETTRSYIDNLIDGPPVNLENRWRCHDESYKWLSWVCRSDEHEQVFYASAREIPSKKEKKAEASELWQILEDSLNEIYIFDAHTLHFIQVNRGARNNLGYSLEQMQALTPIDIKPEFTKPEFEALIAPLRSETEQSLQFTTIHKRKDATRYPVEVYIQLSSLEGVPVFVAIILDITERRLIETEKLTALEQTQAILDTTVEGIITIGERGKIQSFNQAAEKIFQYKAEEVLDQNINMLMPTPYHEEHDMYVENYLKTGTKKIIGIGREVSGKRKNGEIFPMELAVSEIKLGRHRLFTGIVRDISERRKMELEILKISEFERQHIGQELHDGLGSQLSGIGMICQMLSKQLTKTENPIAEEVSEIAGQIKEADYQARNIARGLVPVASEPTGLSQALTRLSSNAQRTYGVTCLYEEVGDVQIHDVTVSTHLYRIAQEAFLNGIKHGKASKIIIRLKRGEDSNQNLHLEIEDNGRGLPDKLPDDRGMGLRTMKYRANVIGGQFSLKSEKNIGTTVSCRLANLPGLVKN